MGDKMESDFGQRLALRALLAKIACGIVFLSSLAMAALDFGQLTGSIDFYYISAQQLAAIQAFGVGYIVAFFVSMILVAMWIHRAHDNLRRADLDGEFTPGWAVGWYFVPFANLVKPYQAMRELWNRSMGNVDAEAVRTPPILPIWWGGWIGGNILGNIAARISDITNPEVYTLSLGLGLVSEMLTILSAVLLFILIARITQAQSEGLGVGQVFA
ncbi:MAG: DUF4328 domain-containing protein [Erythrobacter sp.]|nr:DUF4328 domain-containing protein [Erythrobacter sp.]